MLTRKDRNCHKEAASPRQHGLAGARRLLETELRSLSTWIKI